MSSLDEDCTSANALSEKEIDNKTLDTSQNDILDSKSGDKDGGDLKGSSCLSESGLNNANKNFAVKKPSRASMNNNTISDQAVAFSADGKEIIGVYTVHERTLKK